MLTDGALNWGDVAVDRLVARYEAATPFDTRFFAYRTGLGAENLPLFQVLTGRGAIFDCLSDDAVPAAATAHTAPGFVLSEVSVQGAAEDGAEVPLVETGDVPAEYVAGISHLPEVVRPFSDEAERRLGAGQTGAAVRALSSSCASSSGICPGCVPDSRRLPYSQSGSSCADNLAVRCPELPPGA